MLFNLLLTRPDVFILVAVSLVASISFHEFAHAYVADKLGDPTAKHLGRVTINPLAHLDPLGTLLLLFAGFGWGRPVPYDPRMLRNPKRDSALISLAGPLSNLILAGILAIVLKTIPMAGILTTFLFFVVFYNLILGFFNLIPLHPLDGFKIVNGLLPERLSYQWMQIAPYGIWLLLLLVMTNTTGRIISGLVSTALRIFGLPGLF